MFEIEKKAVVSWFINQNNSKINTPLSIDVGCHQCRREVVNFSFSNWEIRADSMFAESRCPACGAQSRFWIIDFYSDDKEILMENSKIYMFPSPSLQNPFDDKIKNVSPLFIEIYDQSVTSEKMGLDKITGMGYRKALEYLIKDWVSQKNPASIEEIQKMLLGPCIQKFVDDSRVKDCAERAIWLGNDATHYVRKWENKDIDDLKKLLKLTIYWISSSLLTEEYIADMAKK